MTSVKKVENIYYKTFRVGEFYKNYDEVIKWAKKHKSCRVTKSRDSVRLWFSSDEDLVAFRLKFGI